MRRNVWAREHDRTEVQETARKKVKMCLFEWVYVCLNVNVCVCVRVIWVYQRERERERERRKLSGVYIFVFVSLGVTERGCVGALGGVLVFMCVTMLL